MWTHMAKRPRAQTVRFCSYLILPFVALFGCRWFVNNIRYFFAALPKLKPLPDSFGGGGCGSTLQKTPPSSNDAVCLVANAFAWLFAERSPYSPWGSRHETMVVYGT